MTQANAVVEAFWRKQIVRPSARFFKPQGAEMQARGAARIYTFPDGSQVIRDKYGEVEEVGCE